MVTGWKRLERKSTRRRRAGAAARQAADLNGKVTEDKVGPHRDLLAEFLYLGPPHNGGRPITLRDSGGALTPDKSSRQVS